MRRRSRVDTSGSCKIIATLDMTWPGNMKPFETLVSRQYPLARLHEAANPVEDTLFMR